MAVPFGITINNPSPHRPQVKLLYLLELAYYSQELPMLFVWFTKRKDFGQMVAHHIATLGLIAYSLELGCVVCFFALFCGKLFVASSLLFVILFMYSSECFYVCS